MITRVTGSATSSSTDCDPHLAGDLALGEVPVDPVAAPTHLDRDQRVGTLARAASGRRRRASKVTVVDDLDRRVGERHRAVAATTRVPGRQVRAASMTARDAVAPTGRWPARRARRRRLRGDGRAPRRDPSRVMPPLGQSTQGAVDVERDELGRQPADGGSTALSAHAIGSSDLAAPEVRAQRLGHHDRAVGLLVGLEHRDDRAGHGAQGAVERGDRPDAARVEPAADVEPAGLEVGAVRGRRELAVLALGRDPRLAVELALRPTARGRRRRCR